MPAPTVPTTVATPELPWAAFAVDVDGRCEFNAPWRLLLGADHAAGGSADWTDDVVDDERADVVARWAVARVERRPWEVITRLRAQNRVIPVVLRLMPMPTGWYGGLSDLSVERAALDDVKDRLRVAEEAAGIGSWTIDFVAQTTWFSSSMARLLGLQGEQLVPRGTRHVFHPDDYDRAQAAVVAACDPAGPGTLLFEVRMLRDDGSSVWLRSSGSTRFATTSDGGRGAPLQLFATAVDITEIRQAARRLATQNAVSRVLAEATSLSGATPLVLRAVCEVEGWDFGGIWEIDRHDQRLRCAEMWHVPDLDLREVVTQTRRVSHERGRGLPGKVWASAQPIAVADIREIKDDPCADVAIVAGMRGALAFPVVVDGEVTAVLEFCGRTSVVADAGMLEMFAAIGRQLGLFFARQRREVEHRSLEAQLRQAQRIEAIGQLSGGIAHDFNNILAAIIGNVHLAKLDVAADHPVVESLDQISLASTRAKTLVQQILTFARQRPQQRSTIAPGTVVEESVRLLRAIVPAGVNFVVDIAADVPDIEADATQLEQVIVNLGTNAWHALDDSGAGVVGSITIRLFGVDVDEARARRQSGLHVGRHAALVVEDTGRGMPKEVLERVFEPFFTTKPSGKGTGLGLSVVHGIVKSHDGVIGVESEPGRGTRFEILFPGVVERADVVTTTPSAITKGIGEHVLFVDDEAPIVALFKRVLPHLGYQVSGFTSATTALATFLSAPWMYSLVLTDMNMPGMSGMQLATEVLRARPDVPVVLASGYVTDEVQAELQRLGVREVLHKPVDVSQIGAVLARALSRSSVDTVHESTK